MTERNVIVSGVPITLEEDSITRYTFKSKMADLRKRKWSYKIFMTFNLSQIKYLN